MAEEGRTSLTNQDESRHEQLLQAEVQALMMNAPPGNNNNEDSPSARECPSQSEAIEHPGNSNLSNMNHCNSGRIQESHRKSDLDDLDSFNLIEPPPLDWRSDTSSEVGCIGEGDSEGYLQTDSIDMPDYTPSEDGSQLAPSIPEAPLLPYQTDYSCHDVALAFPREEEETAPQTEGMSKGLDRQKSLEKEERSEEKDEGVREQQTVGQGPVCQGDVNQTVGQGPVCQGDVHQTVGQEPVCQGDVDQTIGQGPVCQGDVHQTVGQQPVCQGDVDQTIGQGPVCQGDVDQTIGQGPVCQGDVDHSRIHTLLSHLQVISPSPVPDSPSPEGTSPRHTLLDISDLRAPGPACDSPSSVAADIVETLPRHPAAAAPVGLLFSESHQRDLVGLLEEPASPKERPLQFSSPPRYSYEQQISAGVDAVVSISYSQEDAERFWDPSHRHEQAGDEIHALDYSGEEGSGMVWQRREEAADGREGEEFGARCPEMEEAEERPAYKDVPGPCDPEDLLDGVIFGAKYLGSTQLQTDKNPSTSARMAQAQEAVDRIKEPEGESQPMTEVDLFISTQRIKVLNAESQEAMMDHSLQMISYIADIGNIVVLMARRKPVGRKGSDAAQPADPSVPRKKCWMLCHVFISDDAQVIAQAIGQAFAVAYQQFMHANGIKPDEYDDFLSTQEQYNGDLVHFSRSENIREVCIRKAIGEILGLAVVESGWGSILPTVVVANLLHGGPAERSGELSIGDRIMSVNGTSLVGLPIATCHNIIRDLKSQAQVKLSIVHCPPVTMAIIKRPDPKYQLGFSVEDGIICSLMRGGIAERGGIRVGHRIIEINGQSVVATPHEKIIQILTNAVGEIHLKTMPASTYRLLTGQEQPVFL